MFTHMYLFQSVCVIFRQLDNLLTSLNVSEITYSRNYFNIASRRDGKNVNKIIEIIYFKFNPRPYPMHKYVPTIT